MIRPTYPRLQRRYIFIYLINSRFVLSWRLTLITFIAIPPIALITKIYGSYFDKLSEKTQETIAEANRVAEEAVGSMRTVRSFACEIKEALRFEERLDNTLVVSKVCF